MLIRNQPADGRSIVSESAETFFLKALLQAAGFTASVLVSRGLGPEGRGAYYLPVVSSAVMIVACSLGLEPANVFLRGSRVSTDRLWGQSGLCAVVTGTFGVVMLVSAPWMLPALFADTPIVFLVLAGLTVPFALHSQLSAGLLTLEGRVTRQFRIGLAASAVQVALLLGLFFTPWFAVTAVLGVNLATAILIWTLTVWPFAARGAAWIRWDPALLRQTLRQSLLLHPGMLLFFLHLRLDMFLVKAFVGTRALGEYSLAVGLAETVLLASDSLAIVILPRQIGGSLEEAASMALRGARINALLGALLAATWAAVGVVLIAVFFGHAFMPAYLPLVGLLPGMVFLGMQRVCGGPVLRADRPGRITAIYAMSVVFNTALNSLWIPAWGTLGAALASSVSYGLGAVLFLTWTARLAGVPLVKGIVPTRHDVLALRGVAVTAARRLREACHPGRQAA